MKEYLFIVQQDQVAASEAWERSPHLFDKLKVAAQDSPAGIFLGFPLISDDLFLFARQASQDGSRYSEEKGDVERP